MSLRLQSLAVQVPIALRVNRYNDRFPACG